MSSSRDTIAEAPFAVYPNLWRSAEMVVTPGTRKSQGVTSYPSFSVKGRK